MLRYADRYAPAIHARVYASAHDENARCVIRDHERVMPQRRVLLRGAATARYDARGHAMVLWMLRAQAGLP